MNNYHTHTFRCHHAEGDVPDYIEFAKKAGLSELGFSDHCPFPDRRWSENRMDISDLPSYIEALSAAKIELSAKLGGNEPRILSGLECEWVPEYESFMREEFIGKLALDYLVAGIHNYLHHGEWRDTYAISSASELISFAETSCNAMESGLFSFLAHPDVFCYNWIPWDENARSCAKDILSTSARTRTPLEINGYGMRKPIIRSDEGDRYVYPREEFWKMAAEYKVICIINSDAHRPIDTAANLVEGYAIARKFGIPVIESLSSYFRK